MLCGPPLSPVAALCASIAGRPMLLRWERMAALLGTRSASSPCLIRPALLPAITYRALPSETERYLEYNSDDMGSVRFGLRGVTSKFQEQYDRIDVPWDSQGIFVQTTPLIQKVLTIWNPLCDMTLPIDRSVSITTIYTNNINYQELQCTCFGQ